MKPRLESWSTGWIITNAAGNLVNTLGGMIRRIFPDATTAKAHLDKWRP